MSSALLSVLLPLSLLLLTIGSAQLRTATELNASTTTRTRLQRTAFEEHLQATSILYGLLQATTTTAVSSVCGEQLRQLQHASLQQQVWAMKVLDATANRQPGFIFQHNFWLGSPKTCEAAAKPLHLTRNREIEAQCSTQSSLMSNVAPFALDFRVVHVLHNVSWQLQLNLTTKPILHLGLCLPAACSCDEVRQLVQQWLLQQQEEEQYFPPAMLNAGNAEVLRVKRLQLSERFFGRRSLKLLLTLFSFTGVMMLWSAFGSSKKKSQQQYLDTKLMDKLNELSVATTKGSINATALPTEKTQMSAASVAVTKNSINKFVSCFDLPTNCHHLFATTTTSEIPAVNGLRVVSAFGLLCVHVGVFSLHTMQDLPLLLSSVEVNSLPFVTLSFSFVDVLIAISGFLQTFYFLESDNITKIRNNTLLQNLKLYCVHLLHRFLRIAPLYLVTMGVSDLLTAYIDDVSVFHIYDRDDQHCPKYWWRNILFIQSFFPLREMCMPWSWSLSCQMQYFVVANLFLFIYVKHPQTAKYSVLTLLATNLAWTLFKGTTQKYQSGFEAAFLTMDSLYNSPVVRVLPFIMGAIAAWYLRVHNCVLHIGTGLESFLWYMTLVLILGAANVPSWYDLDYTASTAALIAGRLMLSFAVCWIIVASVTGRSRWWSRILEAQIFQHFNRLTYAIYLLNPPVITLIVNLVGASMHADLGMSLYCTGFAVMVYLTALVFSLAFEMPYCNCSRVVLKSAKLKVQ